MRLFKRLAVLCIALTCLISAFSAQALPNGSYQETCKHCYVFEHRLICHCLTRQQYWEQTSLRRPGHCGFIKNFDGNLICKHAKPFALPRGSYRETCFQCRYNGHRLVCQCRDQNQEVRRSALYGANYCNHVKNRNGRLVCHR
ncbi:MAG: hypothetical protein COB66_02065 [Coxiella sp. (in: Bacteria)]|nr:MAG: hypothetical protein COB66_02065 [Coxiella sp. (in: g-proteobacteria)]